MRYTIWAEGYRATGEAAGATRLGAAEGETFAEACRTFVLAHPTFARDFNEEHLSWGFTGNVLDALKAWQAGPHYRPSTL